MLGPLTSILLALLVQLVVPALLRKLAVFIGTPTRSRREVLVQDFYFTFLFIELVLLTAISVGVSNVVPRIVDNPSSVPTLLANDLPRSANYFFNYLIVQSLGFSGSILFQYLRVLYITVIWPWFTQTPREEAWLQTTIPHQVGSNPHNALKPPPLIRTQMWGNVYSLVTNFAVIGMSSRYLPVQIYSGYGVTSSIIQSTLGQSGKLTTLAGFMYCIISPLMLVFVSITFSLFWVAYRHNYYYVQRNKVDTHGLLFNNALSQLFTGIYVLEIALIGLFFLVRDTQNKVACSSQATIMIVVLVLTAIFHFVMEQNLRPLYEFLPVVLEDSAVDAERRRFLIHDDSEPWRQESGDSDGIELSELNSAGVLDGGVEKPTKRSGSRVQIKIIYKKTDFARIEMSRLKSETATRVTELHAYAPEPIGRSRRREVADQLAAAIAGYPDELTDLSPEERDAELKAAFQDPITREPAPVVWIPGDPAGISDDAIKQSMKYGRYLQYSNAGAYLTPKNKCEITQPAPDVRPDWLLEWVL